MWLVAAARLPSEVEMGCRSQEKRTNILITLAGRASAVQAASERGHERVVELLLN
jgi:hypothetical protein